MSVFCGIFVQYFDTLRIFFVAVDNFLHIVCAIYALCIIWIINVLHILDAMVHKILDFELLIFFKFICRDYLPLQKKYLSLLIV